MGGVEPAGELRARAAAGRQARRHREQAARRPARRRAVRGRVGGGRAAPLRGARLRGDPGDQGAARGARRHERPPRARDRQRDDELHPHARWRRGRPTPRRSPRRSGSGYAEADPTDDVSGADAAAKMAILATVAFGSRVDARRRRRTTGSSAIDAGDVARGARARDGGAARRRGDARRTAASTCASGRRSSTGTIRSLRSRAPSTP